MALSEGIKSFRGRCYPAFLIASHPDTELEILGDNWQRRVSNRYQDQLLSESSPQIQNHEIHRTVGTMKTFATTSWMITLAVTVFARPEPPVNQYLPPNQQFVQPHRGSDLNLPTGPGSSETGGTQYLPPSSNGYSGEGYNGDDASEGSARYEFEYTVNDQEAGSDFGHKESRKGSVARGVYYVLLPDGRRQTVEYEADQDGFRPRVTYTDEGVRGGNARGNGGYAY